MSRWAFVVTRTSGERSVTSCGFTNGRSQDEAEGAAVRQSHESLKAEGKGAETWPIIFIKAWKDE